MGYVANWGDQSRHQPWSAVAVAVAVVAKLAPEDLAGSKISEATVQPQKAVQSWAQPQDQHVDRRLQVQLRSHVLLVVLHLLQVCYHPNFASTAL